MQILVPDVAYTEHLELLRTVDDADWVRVPPSGELVLDDQVVARADVTPEVAWGTAHMFYDGSLLEFFGALLESPTVRWFQSPAAGFDHPVFGALVRKGVRVTTSHGNAIAIAEFVLGSVLRVLQQPDDWVVAQRERAWRQHDFREVWGSTWLVFGVGHIGSEVAARARAFGAHVIGVRRHPSGDEPVDEMVTPDAVHDVVPRCDVVVLAAPATADTEHVVDAAFLARMREGSVLVNIARGALVDEAALLDSLEQRGIPETALLDVFETEPLPDDSPLWDHPRVLVTPHSAAGGVGRYDRNAELFLDNLARYRAGTPLFHELTARDLP